MNSDFSYFAYKCFNFNSKNWSKSCTCPSVSPSVQYVMQSENWTDFGLFFHLFCKYLTRHIQKMTTWTIILNPTTKEPKFCHALAITSAFNLKLCHIRYILPVFLLMCCSVVLLYAVKTKGKFYKKYLDIKITWNWFP